MIKTGSDPKHLYYEAFKSLKGRKVVQAIATAGGISSFSEIETSSGVNGSTLVYHLNRLIMYSIVSSPSKGSYELVYRTPFCLLDDNIREASYFGLLGRRAGRGEPEPEVACALLSTEGMKMDSMHVVTSPDALTEWSSDKLPYQWLLCYEDEIIDIEKVVKKVEGPLLELMRKGLVVLDCTSATKPASLAFYYLAQKYLVPLVYVYEEKRELRWLLSRGDIAEQLNPSGNK
jgi:hypothetical protein